VANFFLGQGHFIAGDYPRAIDHSRRNVALLAGERAFDRFGLTGLPAVLSRQWLARSLAERGEFSEALGHAQEALSIADTGGQPYNLAVARHAAGYVHLVRGDLAEAIPLLERAARVSKTWDLRLLFAPQASTLGWAYALSGRMDEARAILEESAAFRVPAFFLARWGEIAQAAGSLLVGKLAEAAAGASAAAEAAAERGFRGDHAHALALLGEISARRDPPDVAEAEDRIRRALALADELGMRPLAAHCHLDLGALQRRRGEDATAQQELMMAAVMFRDMDMGFWLSRAEAELRG
jgi:tetratricopeptide (TPR) repeat protein